MDNKLGSFIKEQRVSMNISLRKLEEISGISFSHLSKIERGTHQPSKETLEILATSLDADEYELFLLAGYSTEADEIFWKELFKNIDPSWGLNLDKYEKLNGEIDYYKFRNEFVHGGLDDELNEKISDLFFEAAAKKAQNANRIKSIDNRKIVDETRDDIGEAYSKWFDLIDELNANSLEPNEVKNIIKIYSRNLNDSLKVTGNPLIGGKRIIMK